MRSSPSKAILYLISLSLLATTTAGGTVYVIQPGQTLSKALGARIPGPVWGRDGSLRKVLARNPQIKDPNKVFPGQEIDLGDLAEADPTRAPASASQETQLETPNFSPAETKPQAPAVDLTKSDEIPASIEKEVSTLTQSPQEPSFDRHSTVIVSTQASYLRLDGVDQATSGKAIVFSKLNYGLTVDWLFVWSKRFRSLVGFGIQRYNTVPARNGQTIEGANSTDSRFSAGIELETTPNLTLGAKFRMGPELFFVSQGTNGAVSLDHPALFQAESYLRYQLIPTEPLGFGIEASARGLFPSDRGDYSTRFGAIYSGSAYLEQRIARNLLGVSLHYDNGSYASNIARQRRSDLFLNLYFRMNVGAP